MPQIIILSYSEAAYFLRHKDAGGVQALISIHGFREYPIECEHVPHRLVLRFDDVESPDQDDMIDAARVRVRQREQQEIGLSLTPPTTEHARAIIDFASTIRSLDGALLCQCQAGISRSTAAALLCLAAWTGPGDEQACVGHILRLRQAAQPHRDLVRFGDQLLNRGGRLFAALDAING